MDFIALKFHEITPKMKHAHKKLLDHLKQKELDTHTHIKATKNETHTFKNKPPKMLNQSFCLEESRPPQRMVNRLCELIHQFVTQTQHNHNFNRVYKTKYMKRHVLIKRNHHLGLMIILFLVTIFVFNLLWY
jgi:hypothetical protein